MRVQDMKTVIVNERVAVCSMSKDTIELITENIYSDSLHQYVRNERDLLIEVDLTNYSGDAKVISEETEESFKLLSSLLALVDEAENQGCTLLRIREE